MTRLERGCQPARRLTEAALDSIAHDGVAESLAYDEAKPRLPCVYR
jgi:hypothetical protein